MSAVADVLRDARALIDTPKKWAHRHGYVATNGAICPLEALKRCGGGRYADGTNAAAAVLPSQVGATNWYGVGDWNDAPERTHADVLAAFDRAITAAEAS